MEISQKKKNAALTGTLWWVLTALLVIGADQLTKRLAVALLKPVGSVTVIDGIVALTYVENRGAAFGIFSEHRWVHMTVATVAVAAMIVYMIVSRGKYQSKIFNMSMGMVIGGGVGNLIDRFLIGYVVDFIELKFVRFAVFNTADSFVCVGAALLFICVMTYESKHKDDTTPKKEKDDVAKTTGSDDDSRDA